MLKIGMYSFIRSLIRDRAKHETHQLYDIGDAMYERESTITSSVQNQNKCRRIKNGRTPLRLRAAKSEFFFCFRVLTDGLRLPAAGTSANERQRSTCESFHERGQAKTIQKLN